MLGFDRFANADFLICGSTLKVIVREDVVQRIVVDGIGTRKFHRRADLRAIRL